jgi:hypothetical protein
MPLDHAHQALILCACPPPQAHACTVGGKVFDVISTVVKAYSNVDNYVAESSVGYHVYVQAPSMFCSHNPLE